MLKKKGANLLVTGGCGFLGSHLVELLCREGGGRVTVVDNESTGHRANLATGDHRRRTAGARPDLRRGRRARRRSDRPQRRAAGEVYNVGSGTSHTTLKLGRMVAKAMGLEPEFVFTGQVRPGDPQRWQANIERLEEAEPTNPERFETTRQRVGGRLSGLPDRRSSVCSEAADSV